MRRARSRHRMWLVLAIAVILVSWQLVTYLFRIPDYLLPRPAAVATALFRGLAVGPADAQGYYLQAAYTLGESLFGFAVGCVLGIGSGILLWQFPALEQSIMPLIVAFQSVPKVALAPLFVIWFGYGFSSKIVFVVLITYFPLLITSLAGLKSVSEDLIDLLRSCGAQRSEIFSKAAFPASLPHIFSGLELALVYSLIGAIVGEFVGAQRGLGVMLMQMNFAMDVAGAFSVLVLLSASGVVLTALLRRVRNRVLFWAPSERRIIGI